MISDGFLFRANRLCILVGSVHLLLLQEAHGGGLMGHFGAKKTEEVPSTHFFCPRMRRDVEWYVARCNTSGVLNTKTGHVIICIARHLVILQTLICIH